MTLPAEGTLLILTNMGIPLYSARGLSQTISPIKESEVQDRSVNGVLLDMSYSQFRKYQTVISCKDQRAPAISGIWPGQSVIISCVCELAYPTGGTPQRSVVSGSTRTTETGFTFYRPILTCMMGTWDMSVDEYPADVQWAMPFIEV